MRHGCDSESGGCALVGAKGFDSPHSEDIPSGASEEFEEDDDDDDDDDEKSADDAGMRSMRQPFDSIDLSFALSQPALEPALLKCTTSGRVCVS